jgi:hypothetical protein
VSQLVIATPVNDTYGICVTGLPSAGGYAPLWQVAHWLVTGICEWFHFVGFHAVVLWQLTQFTEVGMCVASLPAAALPL